MENEIALKKDSSLLICQIMTEELMPSTANLSEGVQRDAPYAEAPLLSLLKCSGYSYFTLSEVLGVAFLRFDFRVHSPVVTLSCK